MNFTYNLEHVGDTLMALIAPDNGRKLECTRRNDVAHIFTQDSHETIGFNFFNASQKIGTIAQRGAIELSQTQIDQLNQELLNAGFKDVLVKDEKPKFVVGRVSKLDPHPDSDHLHIAQVEVANAALLQIVCGAPNIEAGQKVVVARDGAMLPNGEMIWNGSLRGVESCGMICSARELSLPNAPQVRGILVLDETAITGEAFQPAKHWKK